jgi:hypothetical protein
MLPVFETILRRMRSISYMCVCVCVCVFCHILKAFVELGKTWHHHYDNDDHVANYFLISHCQFLTSPHVAIAPLVAGPPHYRVLTITLRHITLGRTPLDDWSDRRGDLCLMKHNSGRRQASMPPSGIRTRSPTKRAAAETRLRPRGHWDRLHTISALI